MHIPVLLHEAINGLSIKKGDVVVDGTFGGGGHSKAILKEKKDVKLICVDLDENAKKRFEAIKFPSNVLFVQGNFKDTELILNKAGVRSVDKVLLDLGTSTYQLLEDDRGFSFMSDTPLKMTFSESGSHTGVNAYDVVNKWSEETLTTIFKGFGEEPRAKTIARLIVSSREKKEIKTSRELADLIESKIKRTGKTHPATRVFQAIRIAVNDELGVLEEAISSWWNFLNPKGRLAIITFHSLEDRIVKRAFASYKNSDVGNVITKKPISPSKEEQKDNPRSRSAKIRVIEKK